MDKISPQFVDSSEHQETAAETTMCLHESELVVLSAGTTYYQNRVLPMLTEWFQTYVLLI